MKRTASWEQKREKKSVMSSLAIGNDEIFHLFTLAYGRTHARTHTYIAGSISAVGEECDANRRISSILSLFSPASASASAANTVATALRQWPDKVSTLLNHDKTYLFFTSGWNCSVQWIAVWMWSWLLRGVESKYSRTNQVYMDMNIYISNAALCIISPNSTDAVDWLILFCVREKCRLFQWFPSHSYTIYTITVNTSRRWWIMSVINSKSPIRYIRNCNDFASP